MPSPGAATAMAWLIDLKGVAEAPFAAAPVYAASTQSVRANVGRVVAAASAAYGEAPAAFTARTL